MYQLIDTTTGTILHEGTKKECEGELWRYEDFANPEELIIVKAPK